jgi:formylglycine-generating enzyme required for sulfatase activity
MNVFQGAFPERNIAADGYVSTAPVDAFPPNAFGLHNVTGNVWEWCGDWLDVGYYARGDTVNPRGPATGELRVQRGGSYLCHRSYCRRYRVSARFGSEPTSSAGHTGFRVAADAKAIS